MHSSTTARRGHRQERLLCRKGLCQYPRLRAANDASATNATIDAHHERVALAAARRDCQGHPGRCAQVHTQLVGRSDCLRSGSARRSSVVAACSDGLCCGAEAARQRCKQSHGRGERARSGRGRDAGGSKGTEHSLFLAHRALYERWPPDSRDLRFPHAFSEALDLGCDLSSFEEVGGGVRPRGDGP